VEYFDEVVVRFRSLMINLPITFFSDAARRKRRPALERFVSYLDRSGFFRLLVDDDPRNGCEAHDFRGIEQAHIGT
jgi:hypothetical protein